MGGRSHRVDVCSLQRGTVFITHHLVQTQIHQEPPRCPKEEKGPGSILLLENIKSKQMG